MSTQEHQIVVEPTPAVDPGAATEPATTADPDSPAEPIPTVVPDAAAEPTPTVVPSAAAEPTPTVVPGAAAEPLPAAEPAALVEPAAFVESAIVAAVVTLTEPSTVTEPVTSAEVAKVAEPAKVAGTDKVAESSQAAESLVGTTLVGRYKVERLLGQGGMGAVYLVYHTGIRKRMALKVLRADVMRNPAVLARFEREAMAAAHFDHPNVAAAHDYGRLDEGSFFLVLEYVEGQELRAALEQQKGPLPLPRALFIGRQLASALVRAHELGIVHRDLKPENIMLVKREGHSDFVKVLDFGLAQVSRRIADDSPSEDGPAQPTSASAKLTRLGDIFGTPAYMAPEQSVGESTDVRTDLYAVGVILYELITGQRPFTGKSLLALVQEHLSVPPPPMSERAPTIQVPGPVEELVRRLLAKNPDDRLQSPQELLAAIDQLVINHRLSWTPGGVPPSAEAGGASSEAGVAVAPALGSLPGPAAAPRSGGAGLVSRLPAPLRRIPGWLAAVVVGIAVVVPLALSLQRLRGQPPKPPIAPRPGPAVRAAPPPPPSALAAPSALDAAATQGPEALAALAQRFPTDPRVLRAQVRSHISQRHPVEAMRIISKLAQLDPEAGRDPELAQALVAALGSDEESAQAATRLLEQELGEAGVELLYDLTVKQTGARWKPRLNQSLTKADVLAKASPALRVALDLRAARRCESKRELLSRAKSDGDRRSLVQLRSLTERRGCGFLNLQDCWPCLRKSSALSDTIAALETRTSAASGSKP